MTNKKICCLDFDRTISKGHVTNDILVLNEGVKEFIRKIKHQGHSIFLNTYRADLNDGSLETAVNFLQENGIIVDGINPKKIIPNKFDLNASILFVDDEAQAIPLKKSDVEYGVLIVDFISINKETFFVYGI